MRFVIRFLNAGSMKPADIHRQFCEVYGEYAMSDSMIRRWVRHFSEGNENVHDDPRSSRPSVVKEVLVRACGFHVFLHPKTFPGGRRFHDDNEVNEAVDTWFASQAAPFYDAAIQKLVPRYDKCLNNGETMYVHQTAISIVWK
jgi:hypothetical protein